MKLKTIMDVISGRRDKQEALAEARHLVANAEETEQTDAPDSSKLSSEEPIEP